jgi:hypothetical protein
VNVGASKCLDVSAWNSANGTPARGATRSGRSGTGPVTTGPVTTGAATTGPPTTGRPPTGPRPVDLARHHERRGVLTHEGAPPRAATSSLPDSGDDQMSSSLPRSMWVLAHRMIRAR